MNITAYLLTLGGFVLAGILWFGAAWKGQGGKKTGVLCLLILFLGCLLGFVCAKATWLLLRANTLSFDRLWSAIIRVQPDELSYYGGVVGVCLALWLSAKLAGQPARQVMNAFAPMGALIAAGARFGEGFLGMLGTGKYLEKSFFPVAVEISWGDDWKEYYLAVFMLEGLLSLAAMAFALRHRAERDRFLRTLFYLCLPQVFCESLRMQTIAWLFIKTEQLICFLFCEGVLVWYGFRAGTRSFRRWLPALTGLVVCGLTVAEEFALDKTNIPHWITYACMIAGLAAMAVAEHRGYHRIYAKETKQ